MWGLMREETPQWDPLSPLTAGHIQYALKGRVQQVVLNKACSFYQCVLNISLRISHNVTVQISLKMRPLGKSQPCRCAFSTTGGHSGFTWCSFVLEILVCSVILNFLHIDL